MMTNLDFAIHTATKNINVILDCMLQNKKRDEQTLFAFLVSVNLGIMKHVHKLEQSAGDEQLKRTENLRLKFKKRQNLVMKMLSP